MYANAAVSGEAHRSRWQYLRATWLIGCCIVCALLRREDSQFLSLHMIFVVTHDETIPNRKKDGRLPLFPLLFFFKI